MGKTETMGVKVGKQYGTTNCHGKIIPENHLFG